MEEIKYGHCPFCGEVCNSSEEGELGMLCRSCKNDFWFSEALPENYKEIGLKLIKP